MLRFHYAALKTKPRTLLCLTGLTVAEFEALLPSFDTAWQEFLYRQWVQDKPRQRRFGGGRTATLHRVEDKLLFIVLYFKLYPLQEVQGLLFGLSQAQANAWIHRLTPVLRTALGYEKQLPQRQAQNLEQVLAACPSLEFFIDGTERRIQRPQDPQQQKLNYSGKKKTHTRKNLLITDAARRVQYLSATVEGKKHDKAIADAERYSFPADSTLYQDTGFQGYQPAPEVPAEAAEVVNSPPRVQILQPKKKPRGRELTADEKEANRLISMVRIRVEHAINGVKRCRIVKDILRNHRAEYDDLVMETACGLHNFRTAQRIGAA
jgi:hypothetical protein